MPILNGVLTLHDVKDTERFCRRAIDAEMRRLRMNGLSPSDHEEALAYVIAECWWLAERYDPQRSSSFSTYAYPKCRLRFINWLHTKLGRNPKHKQPQYLEDLQPHQTLDQRPDDPADSRSPDLVRLLGKRIGASPQAIDNLDPGKTTRAA